MFLWHLKACMWLFDRFCVKSKSSNRLCLFNLYILAWVVLNVICSLLFVFWCLWNHQRGNQFARVSACHVPSPAVAPATMQVILVKSTSSCSPTIGVITNFTLFQKQAEMIDNETKKLVQRSYGWQLGLNNSTQRYLLKSFMKI